MFNNKKESDKTTGNGGYKLPYFFNLVKVTGLKYHNSKTGKTKFELELESKVDDPDFKGFERIDGTKAKGKLATADIGVYIDATNFKGVSDMLSQMSLLAAKAGIDYNEHLAPIFTKAIKTNDDGQPISLKEETQEYLLKLMNALINVFVKAGGYFWVFIKAEEYKKDKYGNYALLQYNIGNKDNPDWIVWCKSEACVTKTFPNKDKPELIMGVEGINTIGNNKGDSFKKMVEVGNTYQLKPFSDDYDDELNRGYTDNLGDGDDDLPF